MNPTLEHVLLVGDRDRQVRGALEQALPGASVTAVDNYFDAIHQLTVNHFTAILASAEPIERRPEAAVQTLRQLAGDSRFVLFGQSSLEPVSRKMLSFGSDDYVITPVAPGELSQVFGTPPLRIAAAPPAAPGDPSEEHAPGLSVSPPTKVTLLSGLPLAEIVLDAILKNPHGGPAAAVGQINARIAPAMELHFVRAGAEKPATPEGLIALTHAVRIGENIGENVAGSLHLMLPRDEEETGARHFLAQLAILIAKLATVQDRYLHMERLAVTDDLTGLANSRYFHSFLKKIIRKAQAMRFPVTLLLFDIDGFKSYNDQFGHKAGDEILRATASLIKRCVRDHDLVARLHGDEFAVVFWEKEGPRQPREGNKPPTTAATAPTAPTSRIPQTPKQMFQRFQRMLASNDFQTLGLGPNAKGKLTISAAMAVYPYDAQTVEGLIDAADHELMFNAKVSGKNCLRLVGEDPDDDNDNINPAPSENG